MKKLVILGIVATLLSSCYKESISTEKVGDFQVEFIFEKDGIKVYRFMDGGRAHYFTNRGETISTHRENKSNRDENIY